jgi:quinol monooxygenase YgiN
MLVLAVTWVAKEGKDEQAVELFRRLTVDSRKEPGCMMYIVHRHNENPRNFFIYEQYRDQAALDAHRAAPHFQKIAAAALPEIAERKEGNLYTPLDGN